MPQTSTQPFADFSCQRLLIVRIHEKTIKERGSLYEAARRFWAVSPDRAEDRPVLAMSLEDRTILEAYNVDDWHVIKSKTTKNGSIRHYYEFDGKPADAESWLGKLVGKRVLPEYEKGQAVFRYVN